jgi:Arc/MetJ-type ribon-helix-helix transcriptional regulator
MRDEFNASGDIVIEEKKADSDDIVVTKLPNEGGRAQSDFDLASSVRDVAQRTGEVLKGATESISKAIESALSARDHVVMVRVNDDSLRKLDMLVQSGIFKSRSEAAAFLISEGVKAQQALFSRIADKINEIERLQSELKNSITPQEP